MKPLMIVPNYTRGVRDLELLCDCVDSIRRTEGDKVDVLVIDDGSPARDLIEAFDATKSRWSVELVTKQDNEGFSRTVNVGLERARDEERDAILVNADVEFFVPWLDAMLATERLINDGPADVVGALLLYPQSGLIQHAGVHFSLLTRQFWHTYQYAPQNLPEALAPSLCPVTGALQLIRAETLKTIGVYDPQFRMGWEDMDYCIRVFLANGECVYNPEVRAYHGESMFRGRPTKRIAEWTNQSFGRLVHKYREQSFAGLVPTW